MLSQVLRFGRAAVIGISMLLGEHFMRDACCQTAGEFVRPRAWSTRISTARDETGNVVGMVMILVTDEDVESVDFSVLPKLEGLVIHSEHLTNRSIRHLRKLPANLTMLMVMNANIGDREFIPVLRQLKLLHTLVLDGTGTTDRMLPELGKLEKLRSLVLKRTKITDAGLEEIANLPKLNGLDLTETRVSDVGLKEIGKITELLEIHLSGTKITDRGLRELAGIERLAFLDVSNTQVTDAGILLLQNHAFLKELNVSNTRVTDRGKAELKALLPDLQFIKTVPEWCPGEIMKLLK